MKDWFSTKPRPQKISLKVEVQKTSEGLSDFFGVEDAVVLVLGPSAAVYTKQPPSETKSILDDYASEGSPSKNVTGSNESLKTTLSHHLSPTRGHQSPPKQNLAENS